MSGSDDLSASASAAAPAPAHPRVSKIASHLDPERRQLAVYGRKDGDAWIGDMDGARICGCPPFAFGEIKEHLEGTPVAHVCPGCARGQLACGADTDADVRAPGTRLSSTDTVLKRLGAWWPTTATIADIVRDSWTTTVLNSALKSTGLDNLLGDPGDGAQKYTLFAPIDAAFDRPYDTPSADELRALINRHIVTGTVTSQSIPADGSALVLSTIAGTAITLQRAPDMMTVIVNGTARVTWLDIHASNGVVHVIDRLLPQAPVSQDAIGGPAARAAAPNRDMDVVNVIAERSELATYRAMVARAGMTKDIAADGASYTVFVPSNASFEGLDADEFRKLLPNDGALRDMLRRHTVPAKVTTRHFKDAIKLKTQAATNPPISAGGAGELYVGGKRIIETIVATNGVVYIVDGML